MQFDLVLPEDAVNGNQAQRCACQSVGADIVGQDAGNAGTGCKTQNNGTDHSCGFAAFLLATNKTVIEILGSCSEVASHH